MLACCLKCQRLQCLRCAICIWFRTHICICIRNHVRKISRAISKFGLSICSCLPKPFAFKCGIVFSMGNCVVVSKDQKEKHTRLHCSKMSKILIHFCHERYNAMVVVVIAKQFCLVLFLLCCFFLLPHTNIKSHAEKDTQHSNFSIVSSIFRPHNRHQNFYCIHMIKIDFAFSFMISASLSSSLALRIDLVLCKWIWLCHSLWQFDLYIRFDNHSVLFVCLLACLYKIISMGSKSQQMSKFNIRLVNALNNLRATIFGTLFDIYQLLPLWLEMHSARSMLMFNE